MSNRQILSEKIERDFWAAFGYLDNELVYCDECLDEHAATNKDITS